MNSPLANHQRRPHRRLQFSLKLLLVLVLASGAGLGARWLRHKRRARIATELAAPVAPLLQYVPYYEPTVDVVSGRYGRTNLALCVLRRTGHVRGDSAHICAVLAHELERYRQLLVVAKALREFGAKGGDDHDVSNATFHVALVEAAIALEEDDAEKAGKKLSECLKLAKQYGDQRRQIVFSMNEIHLLSYPIRIVWSERISARQRADEAGYARALEAQARLLNDLIARLQTVSDKRQPDPLVEAARLARAWVRARLANAACDDTAETTAWRQASAAAKALRSIAPVNPPPNDPGGLFDISGDYWCGVAHPLLLSEPGLIFAESFHRGQSAAARVAQQAALAEYEALCREAAQRASGSVECPEFWECLHSLARLDQMAAGY